MSNNDSKMRNEVLRKALANIYYYLEMYDEKDKPLLLQYNILLSKEIYLGIEMEEYEARMKAIKTILQHEIRIKINTLHEYKVEYQSRQDKYLIKSVVEITLEDYLDGIYNRLYDIIPLVDIYNQRPEIDLEGISQAYGLGYYEILQPTNSLENFDVDILTNRKRY